MVWTILFIGTLNLCIGFALAVYLSRTRMPKIRLDKLFSAPAQPQPEEQPEPEEAPQPLQRLDEDAITEEIPDKWMDILKEKNVVASSFVEASVQVLRLEVGRYRDSLIGIDRRVRRCRENPDLELIKTLLIELKEVNEAWLDQQSDASEHLSSRSGGMGALESMGSSLENVLMDQAAQIETTCNNIDLMDFETDIPAGCTRLVTEIRKLIDLAHSLRDSMHDSLLAIVKTGDRLGSLDKQLQIDSLTGIHNRTGLEKVFYDLWREDPNRIRQISCGMIDLDRFGRLLEEHGAIGTDRLLRAFSTLFADLVRKDRGFDVAARFDGQRFFTFFGDTGPHNATSAMERIRQTIEATTFDLDGFDIDLTVSCGVTEVQPKDTTEMLYERLLATVREAKKQGRNCTFLDEGEGPEEVHPPEYEVSAKIVQVGV